MAHVLIIELLEDGSRLIRCQCGFEIAVAPPVIDARINGMDRDDWFAEVRTVHTAHRSKEGCSDFTTKIPWSYRFNVPPELMFKAVENALRPGRRIRRARAL